MSHGEYKTADKEVTGKLAGKTDEKLIGKLAITHESSKAYVSGTAEYVDDRPMLRGEVFVEVYYSQVAHAEVVSIDLKEALAVEGVLGIYGSDELQMKIWGNIFHDQPF